MQIQSSPYRDLRLLRNSTIQPNNNMGMHTSTHLLYHNALEVLRLSPWVYLGGRDAIFALYMLPQMSLYCITLQYNIDSLMPTTPCCSTLY